MHIEIACISIHIDLQKQVAMPNARPAYNLISFSHTLTSIGIQVQFGRVVGVIEKHGKDGATNLYFVCSCVPMSFDIQIQEREIAACKVLHNISSQTKIDLCDLFSFFFLRTSLKFRHTVDERA